MLPKNSDIENFMDMGKGGGGERHDFRQKPFVSQCRKKLVEHLFSVSLVSSMTIVYA